MIGQRRVVRRQLPVNGRADAVYNRFVIEYEPPRSLRSSNTSQSNQHAIDQVKQYIEELATVERRPAERLAGVATDGSFYIFVRFRNSVCMSMTLFLSSETQPSDF